MTVSLRRFQFNFLGFPSEAASEIPSEIALGILFGFSSGVPSRIPPGFLPGFLQRFYPIGGLFPEISSSRIYSKIYYQDFAIAVCKKIEDSKWKMKFSFSIRVLPHSLSAECFAFSIQFSVISIFLHIVKCRHSHNSPIFAGFPIHMGLFCEWGQLNNQLTNTVFDLMNKWNRCF